MVHISDSRDSHYINNFKSPNKLLSFGASPMNRDYNPGVPDSSQV